MDVIIPIQIHKLLAEAQLWLRQALAPEHRHDAAAMQHAGLGLWQRNSTASQASWQQDCTAYQIEQSCKLTGRGLELAHKGAVQRSALQNLAEATTTLLQLRCAQEPGRHALHA